MPRPLPQVAKVKQDAMDRSAQLLAKNEKIKEDMKVRIHF